VAPVQVDVVVVGAGPAGLACACALSGRRVVLLEREQRHGGRVLTARLGGQCVDLGACFAFDRTMVPPALRLDTGRFIAERDDIGLCRDGRIHFAATPLESLGRMQPGSDVLQCIERFANGRMDISAINDVDARNTLDALLHQLHPGAIEQYHSAHQRDGLYTWYPDHWENGNAALVDALLAQSGAQVLLGAEACALEQRGDSVEIRYTQGKLSQRLSARAAVIATTADVADGLLQAQGLPSRRLFDATRYGSYIVVALAGAAAEMLPRFRSLVPLDGAIALVMQQRAAMQDGSALLCYYSSARYHALASLSDDALVALTREQLGLLGIGKEALLALADTAVRRWERAATILSSEYRACSGADMQLLGERLFIAGDYVATAQGTGYGMADAVASGFAAAQRLRAVLD